MKISVIIVSYNSFPVLKSCLESLKNQRMTSGMEILVVDNASMDGTPEMVSKDFPNVRLIRNTENVGFSKGVNIGIRKAKGDYFFIINPDTVVEKEALAKLIQFMEANEDVGIVGPKLVFFDGNIQYSCRRFYNWKVLLLRRTFLGKIIRDSKAVRDHLMLDFDHAITKEVDWLLGACMLVRREAVQSVGVMDERFFLYFEDVDWCYRMKQKGWKVFYYPEAIVTHGYARESAQKVFNRSFLAHLASLFRYYEKWSFLLYFAKKYREVFKIVGFLVVDVIAFNLAFIASYYLRVNLHHIFTNPIFPIATYTKFIFFENLLFVFTYFALGLYRVRRETSYIDELIGISKAIIFASILLMTSTYLSKIRTYSRMIVALLVPFAVIFDWAARTALRAFHKKLLTQKIDLKRICIVGPMERAMDLEQSLSMESSMGLEVVGIIASDEDTAIGNGDGLGSMADLEKIIDRYRVQELIILPADLSPEELAKIVTLGRKRVIDVTVITDYSNLVIHQAKVSSIAGRPVITYHRDTGYVVNLVLKRSIDVLVGMVFLVASFPFFMVYYLYTRLRGGKIFYYEQRLGINAKEFSLPRLAASSGGSEGDHKHSDLVNFPLFWKVIKGELSIVGPYPFPVVQYHLLDSSHRFRFDVRPGVTGYWRLGKKTDIALDELLAQDAEYVRNWSLVVDISILLRSFWNVALGRKGILNIVE